MKFVTKFVGHENKLNKLAARANHRGLKACGAYVRKIARDFVKHRNNPEKHSEPLHSPFDHFGLKNSIVFAQDSSAVYIGPRYIKNGLANAARLNEFGGDAVVKDIDMDLWEGVKQGMLAPITVTHQRRGDTVIRRDTHVDPKTGKKVVWIHIATQKQAEHSTRLYHRMSQYITATRLVKYPPRPYMAPALMKAMPYLPALWKDSVKK